VVIVVFDEAIKSDRADGGGRVMVVMAGPHIGSRAKDRRTFSHFSLLAGLENHFGVSLLRHAATVTPLPIPDRHPRAAVPLAETTARG